MSEPDHAAVEPHHDPSSAHGHESTGEALGEPDLQAWAAAILGGGIGLLVALALFVASQS